MRGPGRARAALAVLVGAVTCACAQIAPVAAPTPDMPGCDQAGEFAFVGETSLAAIGLGEFGGQDADRPGMVWVTAGPASMDGGPGPRPAGGLRPAEPVGRVACIQWPDGSGRAGHIPADWQPPGGLLGAPAPVDADTGTPTVLLVLAAVAILIGVSFLAFRERRTA